MNPAKLVKWVVKIFYHSIILIPWRNKVGILNYSRVQKATRMTEARHILW